MKSIVLVIIFLLLTTSFTYSQETAQPLQLTIKSDKEAYSQGEDIKLSATFKNNGEKDISFCKYILDYKLLTGIELKDKEGVIYKIIDLTKYKWPIVTKDNFISLAPNEEYRTENKIATIFSSDSALWYGKPNYTSEYSKELLGEVYRITAVYENVADYFQELITKNGYTTTKNIPVKNAWTGTLISNTIVIEVAGGRGKPDVVYPDVKEFNDLKKCTRDSDCIASCTQSDCFNRPLVNDCLLTEKIKCACINKLCQKVQ